MLMSDSGHAAHPSVWRRFLLGTVIAVAAAAVSFGLVLVALGNGEAALLISELTGSRRQAAPAPKQPAPQSPAPSHAADEAAGPAPRAADKPRFDIVRIAPSGSAVVAGRAAPDAEIAILDNGVQIGQTRADSRGEWVFLPPNALAPGGRELTLAARGTDGSTIQGDTPVIVIVPARPESAPSGAPLTPAPAPVVLAAPPDAAPRLLQAPAPPAERSTTNARNRLALDVVDYDDQGAIRFAGRAPAGTDLRAYIDERAAGEAHTDPQGRWTMIPTGTVGSGDHRLRIDQLGDAGRVAARVELPFQRFSLSAEALGQSRIVVQPRQTLWQLARRAYGQGVRYTVIYDANRDQIRDPKLIYPGQVFALPATPAAQAAVPKPVSSSSVR